MEDMLGDLLPETHVVEQVEDMFTIADTPNEKAPPEEAWDPFA